MLKMQTHALTYVWLINRLERYGVITEKSEMSSVVRGTRRGAKAELIIKTSLKILGDYETAMGKCS
jgi:hypothetical protein